MRVKVRRSLKTEAETVEIQGEFIKLSALLKLSGLAETGGEANIIAREGAVLVNGEPCSQRGKKIRPGDRVSFGGREISVVGAGGT